MLYVRDTRHCAIIPYIELLHLLHNHSDSHSPVMDETVRNGLDNYKALNHSLIFIYSQLELWSFL